jgi:hypothetical protein
MITPNGKLYRFGAMSPVLLNGALNGQTVAEAASAIVEK